MKGVALRHVLRTASDPGLDQVAVEEPLEIRVDGEAVATTMRTPGADADLALGFLLAEGILRGASDVGTVTVCGRPGDEGYGNVVDVRSAAGIRLDPERILEGSRSRPIGSACGVCGRRSIGELVERAGRLAAPTRVTPETVVDAVNAIRDRQPIFSATGGLHAALLVSSSGEVLAAAEDVGRHNAVDKAVGSLLRRGLVGASAAPAAGPAVLAVSSRAGFEIVQKAAAAGIPVVASVSAPTSLAIDLAETAGIALCGFVRGGRCNVYANGWRLGLADAPSAGG
jgi:FdhD protein